MNNNACIISGSPRQNSNTLRVCKNLASHLTKKNIETTVIDFYYQDIPFANQGNIDINNLSGFQNNLLNSWKDAAYIFIITPEYNWFPTAEIVNMIHQLGSNKFKHLFEEKIFSFGAVSSGRGGRMPAIQLQYVVGKLISVMNCESIISSKILETQFAQSIIDEEGRSLGNDQYDNGLINYIDYSLQLGKRFLTTQKITQSS